MRFSNKKGNIYIFFVVLILIILIALYKYDTFSPKNDPGIVVVNPDPDDWESDTEFCQSQGYAIVSQIAYTQSDCVQSGKDYNVNVRWYSDRGICCVKSK